MKQQTAPVGDPRESDEYHLSLDEDSGPTRKRRGKSSVDSFSRKDSEKAAIQSSKTEVKSGLSIFTLVAIGMFAIEDSILEPLHLSNVILMGLLAWVGYLVIRFRRWQDEIPKIPLFAKCFIAMLLELYVENFLVWAVSASNAHKYEETPLQDNVKRLFEYLGELSPLIYWFFEFHWGDTIRFLILALALAFSVARDQLPFSGFGMMARFVLTVAVSRIIRVILFCMTVLPAAHANCYMRKFPPPPDNWTDWIKIGILNFRGIGGCNDLIFSGHCALWVLSPLLFQTYYANGNRLARYAIYAQWILLVQTAVRDVLHSQHYSVDMFLAVLVVWVVWEKLDWVYPASRPLKIADTFYPAKPSIPTSALLMITGPVLFAALMVFLWGA